MEGATCTAKILVLQVIQLYRMGADIVYYVPNRGVGNVKMEMTAVDIPSTVLAKILGHQALG